MSKPLRHSQEPHEPNKSDINEHLIPEEEKKNNTTNEVNCSTDNKIHSFLDEGPILMSKLPKQMLDLIWIASPNIATMLGVFYYNFINMYFARRMDNKLILGAFGVGATWYAATSLCIQISISNGLFIQLAQAFGAKNFKLMQHLLQRCQGIMLVIGIGSSFLMWNTKDILIFMGIDEDVSELTQSFVRACIPSIFGTIMYDTLKQYLMAQNVFDIPMKVQVIVYFIHPFWCYLFTEIYDIGIFGIGISRTLAEWTGYLLITQFITRKNLIQESMNFKYELKILFSEWIPFLKIAIPVGALVMAEWIFYELQTIIVAKLNDKNILSGQTAFSSLGMFFFMTPLGISWTTNSYLGNSVGEGKVKLCQQFSKIIIINCALVCLLMMVIGMLLFPFFYGVFVIDDEMGQYFSFAYHFYIFGFLIGDFYQVTLTGIMKCCDQQNFAAVCCILVYYGLGVPATIFLTFYMDLKLTGVWIVQSLVATIVSFILYIKIINIDWKESIEQVKLRVQKKKIQNEELQELNKL